MMKIEGSGSASISQRHGSADPDPDPHQNVMDPQPWLQGRLEDLAAQLLEAEDRVADLQRLADQSRSLKDEVDILRETSDKVSYGFWITCSGYRQCCGSGSGRIDLACFLI